MYKCARIIATCFLPKKVVKKTLLTGDPLGFFYHSQNFTTTIDIINLLKYNIKIEEDIDPGLKRDLIIVNSDVGNLQGNNFLNSLNEKEINKGKIIIYHRNNSGLSFGAFSDAFKKYRNHYDYFIFTEDDLSIIKENYFKYSTEIFKKNKHNGFLSFISTTKIKGSIAKKLKIKKNESIGCHGFCGLSSSYVLGKVYDKFGKLPHNDGNDYKDGITYGEVKIPLEITRAGFKIINQPDNEYLALPSYDLMRGIITRKYPKFSEKILYYSKNFIYFIMNTNIITKKIYFFLLSIRRLFN